MISYSLSLVIFLLLLTLTLPTYLPACAHTGLPVPQV
jgi:hypothetical protein